MQRGVLVIVLLLLAGCQGVISQFDTTITPTPEQQTPTGTLAECEEIDRTTAEGSDHLTPKPMPDWPDSLTKESIETYVVDFEKAYAWNTALSEQIESATVYVLPTNVTQIPDGFVVTLDVQAGYTERITIDNGTPIEQAADDWYVVGYYITNRSLRRSVSRSASDTLEPRNGTIVKCPG